MAENQVVQKVFFWLQSEPMMKGWYQNHVKRRGEQVLYRKESNPFAGAGHGAVGPGYLVATSECWIPVVS